MLVLGYDLEGTGLDVTQDRIIELGAVIWDTETNTVIDLFDRLVKPEGVTLSDEIVAITGISQALIDRYGVPPQAALVELNFLVERYKPEMVIAHNGRGYDFPLLRNEYTRAAVSSPLFGLPVLDTVEDIPFPAHVKTRALGHLAAEHGFLNPFSHRALFDVLTMFKVLAQYSFDEVLAYSKVPWLVVQAQVSYDQRELAKARRYSWEKVGDRSYPKKWVRRIKQTDLEKEQKDAPFRVTVL